MNPAPGKGPQEKQDAPLPLRDWILLPMVSVLTIILIAGSTEFTARKLFTSSKTGYERCEVLDDLATGVRGIPNSVCWEKAPESPLIEYRFNSCGHRAGIECGPKAAGSYRIVTVGSSLALGQYVRQDGSFAALLPKELTRRTGRQVEVYNEGIGFGFSHSTVLRFKDAIDAQPDLILWILTPPDISRGGEVLPHSKPDPGVGLSLLQRERRRLRAAIASNSVRGAFAELFKYSRTDMMVRHFLYESQSETLKSSENGHDDEHGYLLAETSAAWQDYLGRFEKDAAEIEGQSKAAGIPIAAVLVPARAQATMISAGRWPSEFDPYKLDDKLRSIVTRNGGVYIDIVPDFRLVPNPERGYFPFDGHPNEKGHKLIAMLLAGELTKGSVPALTALYTPETRSAEKR